MSTKAKANKPNLDDLICQGDIFQHVVYNYISKVEGDDVEVTQFEFPYAMVVSQSCDVIGMDHLVRQGGGGPAKFMPSILMCPIYSKKSIRESYYVEDAFVELGLNYSKETVLNSEGFETVKKDSHYRFHLLDIEVNKKPVMQNQLLDFKHYFSIPMAYLLNSKESRILKVDDVFAEQVTLKFAAYLARVAIP